MATGLGEGIKAALRVRQLIDAGVIREAFEADDIAWLAWALASIEKRVERNSKESGMRATIVGTMLLAGLGGLFKAAVSAKLLLVCGVIALPLVALGIVWWFRSRDQAIIAAELAGAVAALRKICEGKPMTQERVRIAVEQIAQREHHDSWTAAVEALQSKRR